MREVTAQLDDLKELLETKVHSLRDILSERDQRYKERIEALERHFTAAMLAQEKFNAASVTAGKEAVDKAEEAQKEVNIRTNEFRGQLGDQAATLMPRKETEAEVNSLRLLIETNERSYRDLLNREMQSIQTDIKSLRESRSAVLGKSEGTDKIYAYMFAAIGWIIAAGVAIFAAIWKGAG